MFDIDDRDGVMVLRMNVGKANAMDIEFCQQFVATLEQLDTPATEAVVITGTGSIFSAGVDLPRLLDGGAAYVREFLPALNHFFASVFVFPRPVVAAINGHAIAGGCVLACACDRRIMVRGDGRLGVPELHVGVPFPAEPLEIMRAAVPPQWFAEIITGGALYQSDAAMERGLIDELVAPEQLLDRALEAARATASVGPALFSLTKQQIRQPAMKNLELARRYSREVDQMWAAPASLAAIRDYVEKTFKPAR